MATSNVHGQEMDEGLEEMWTESTHGISSINPGKFAHLPKEGSTFHNVCVSCVCSVVSNVARFFSH